jgi:small subunit ribosomal protein S6
MEKETKMYEIGYLLSPLISEEKLDEEISALRKLIEDKQGFIMNESRAKSRSLAYPIKGFNSAYFGWIKFAASPEVLPEIKISFDNPPIGGDKVVRFLIIKTIKETAVPRLTKKIVKKRISPERPKEKLGIKPEEIDKKIEELIGHEA